LVELVVLVLANLAATAVRFVLLRGWVFHPADPADLTSNQRNRLMTITADMPPQTSADEPPRHDGMLARLVLGDGSQPRWVRPALLVLLVATGLLYLWALGSSGWANNYYAAAAQAGTQDLKAWLFGSLDPGNAITVDKPPARCG